MRQRPVPGDPAMAIARRGQYNHRDRGLEAPARCTLATAIATRGSEVLVGPWRLGYATGPGISIHLAYSSLSFISPGHESIASRRSSFVPPSDEAGRFIGGCPAIRLGWALG